MTKKLFIIILTLCLAVVAMTVVAMADVPVSVEVAGIALASGQYVDSGADSAQTGDPTSGSGYAYYLNGTLYLNNFTADVGYTYAINARGDLTIEISGTNSISSNNGVISLGGNLNITGNGCLTAKVGIFTTSGVTVTPSTGGILEVTMDSTTSDSTTSDSTTSYYSEATLLGTLLYGTITIKPHTHSYVNNECACGAKDYGTIEVGYVTLKDGQYALVDGSSMTVYDGTPSGTSYAYFSGGVLYLNNYLYRDGIFYSGTGDLTINLTGTCFITYVEVHGNLSISGTGSLTVTAEDYYSAAIYANGDITIKGVTIDVTSNEGFAIAIETRGSVIISGSDVTLSASVTDSGDAAMTIYASVDIVIENGSTLTATASFAGEKGIARTLYAVNSISITDSTVTNIEASGYAGHAMHAQMGAITITNSTVNVSATATADEDASYGYDGRAIYAEDGNITITESTVTASATAHKSYAVYAGGDVAISGESTVTTTATATLVDGYSYGIYAGGKVSITGESTATVAVTGNDGPVNPYGIYANGNIAITDNSTVSLTATSVDDFDVSAIYSDDGSIEINKSEVTVEINGRCGYGVISTLGDNNDIIITESKVTATITNGIGNNVGAFGAIGNGSDIIISGSDITVTSTAQSWETGTIYANGSVSISDSKIYAKSTSKGTYGVIRAGTGATISNSELELIASGTNFAYAIYVSGGDLEIESSDVTLTATSTTAQSAIYVTSGDIILTPGTDEALEVTLGTNNPVYYYSETTVEDNGWSSYGYVKIAVSNHTHSYTSSVTTEATCTNDGVMTYTCTCGDSYTETIPATGHSYVGVVTAPTCTEKGFTTYTCSVCGDSYVADETEALGHKYEATVTAPTCTEKGYTTYTCSVCGDTYTVDGEPATGHTHLFTEFTWAGDLLSANAVYTCHCGDTVTAEATVTMQGDNGVYTMTATITDSDGTVRTDTQTAGVSLSTIAADYSLVNSAIEKANSLSASTYSNFDIVTNAISKVQWNLSVVNQETVNSYAKEIETAIANLLPADTTEVNIDEPIENTDTETEPDEEAPVEENPTMGIALALLPVALTLAGAVVAKHKRV
ncbi:MAG: carbohydrate-binding domain-containing protein [Oscillospiraceae bacterium]|nr:carbohydrate-binding domain-containing protein [Oscillospiraceae bacterium]